MRTHVPLISIITNISATIMSHSSRLPETCELLNPNVLTQKKPGCSNNLGTPSHISNHADLICVMRITLNSSGQSHGANRYSRRFESWHTAVRVQIGPCRPIDVLNAAPMHWYEQCVFANMFLNTGTYREAPMH